MDRIQKYNQRLLRNAVKDTRLVRSIDVLAGRRILLTSSTWQEYWQHSTGWEREVAQLETAWTTLVAGRFAAHLRRVFVRSYFQLLHECLDAHTCGQNTLPMLKKIVGFETIRISDHTGRSAAAIINARHPVYLLGKLARPDSPDDPKYLPLVCLCEQLSEHGELFWHYRRIPVRQADGIQLFVYPPADVPSRPSSHALVGQLLACLTPRSDPRIRQRSKSLFEGVFGPLAARSASPRLRLLDMACGSAKITMTLCKRASAMYGKSFDLTLIDVVRGNRSIANTFYRNPKVFANTVYCQDCMFNWIDANAGKPGMRFDVALLLRACNLFSRFSIEEMSLDEVSALVGQDTNCSISDPQVFRPAELIESNRVERIQHGIGRIIFRNGRVFRQFSASDYFKAIHVVTGGTPTTGEHSVFMPLRAFDDKVLVLPSGRSLIAELLRMADQLVIEDADLLPSHLRHHVRQFALPDLSVTDLTKEAKRRGAAVYLIERRARGKALVDSVRQRRFGSHADDGKVTIASEKWASR